MLLVEGEDDKRVFEQIMRSSQGKIKFSPCIVGTVTEMAKWEKWLDTFLPSIYDEPKAYSIRDLDDSSQSDIDDIGCVTRTRLNCYGIENLLLSNENLKKHGYSPEEFCLKIKQWAELNPGHQTTDALNFLHEKFNERRTYKIKDLRNIILALLGTSKPWEVLVGQLIVDNLTNRSSAADSINTYLGAKVIDKLFS